MEYLTRHVTDVVNAGTFVYLTQIASPDFQARLTFGLVKKFVGLVVLEFPGFKGIIFFSRQSAIISIDTIQELFDYQGIIIKFECAFNKLRRVR